MSREIIINNPKISDYDPYYRRYSYNDRELDDHMAELFYAYEITPRTHPLACELFAGDAPVANFLLKRGWKPQDITCIDKAVSPTPLASKVNWHYWDLEEFCSELRIGQILVLEILQHKEKYNLVFSLYDDSIVDGLGKEKIVNFFLKPDGKKFVR